MSNVNKLHTRRFFSVVWKVIFGIVCSILVVSGLLWSFANIALGADPYAAYSNDLSPEQKEVLISAKNVPYNKLTPVQKRVVDWYALIKWNQSCRSVNVTKIVKDFDSNPIRAKKAYAPMWEVKGRVTEIKGGLMYATVELDSVLRLKVYKSDPALEELEQGMEVVAITGTCGKTLGFITCDGPALIPTAEDFNMSSAHRAHVGRAIMELYGIDVWNEENVAGYGEGSSLYRKSFR